MNKEPGFLVGRIILVYEPGTGALVYEGNGCLEIFGSRILVLRVENGANDRSEFRPIAPILEVCFFALPNMLFTCFVLGH
jgi:hypothetical protein